MPVYFRRWTRLLHALRPFPQRLLPLPRHRPQPRPAEEHNADLLQEIGLFENDPPSEDDVHRAMSRVFRALAANRISTRRAATFGYLAQLLLTSKGKKESRYDSGPLSEMLLKLACYPAHRIPDPTSTPTSNSSAKPPTQPPLPPNHRSS